MGISLKALDLSMNVKPLLRVVCESFFGTVNGLVDACVNLLPSPVACAANKVLFIFMPYIYITYRLNIYILVLWIVLMLKPCCNVIQADLS